SIWIFVPSEAGLDVFGVCATAAATSSNPMRVEIMSVLQDTGASIVRQDGRSPVHSASSEGPSRSRPVPPPDAIDFEPAIQTDVGERQIRGSIQGTIGHPHEGKAWVPSGRGFVPPYAIADLAPAWIACSGMSRSKRHLPR